MNLNERVVFFHFVKASNIKFYSLLIIDIPLESNLSFIIFSYLSLKKRKKLLRSNLKKIKKILLLCITYVEIKKKHKNIKIYNINAGCRKWKLISLFHV